jgi:hypothetical protein
MAPILPILADAAAVAADTMVSGAWVTGFVGTVIASVFAGMKVAQNKKMQMGPQPFEVDVRKSYVTREECLACKNESRSDVREMRALYEKTVVLFQTSNEKLSDQIKTLAVTTHTQMLELSDEGAERRRRIHDKLNTQGDLLSHIDARTDVSKSIGKLGSAIMALANRKEKTPN